MSREKVLVFGDDTRSFLATVRSLGRQGIEVHAAPANFAAPALRSRYIARTHDLPPWTGEGEAWTAALERLIGAEGFAALIPCNETALLPLQRQRARLAARTVLAIPDDRAIAVLFDKHETRVLAQGLHIPVAPGRLPRAGDTAASVFAELGTPVMAKPRRSFDLGRLHARGKVTKIGTEAQLAALLPGLAPEDWLLEGFVPGSGLGVSILARSGRVLQAFEHHRLRESGGSSYYRVSATLTPALVQACEAVAAALSYTGLAMFEFRQDAQSGAWVLLEVNARPWGSMPLPLALGVDFPWRWYRLLTRGEETPPVAYRTGVIGRNLLPDVYLTLAEAAETRSPAARARLLAGRALELGRILAGREVQDVLVRDDPRPGLAEFREFGGVIGARLARALPARDRLARARGRRRLRAALRAGGAPPTLVFVCLGNICRSPFAAAALLRALPERLGVTVHSRGMLPLPGRPTPDHGVAAAGAMGYDLRPHRSALLTPEEAAAATALVVFDERTREAVENRFPALRARVVKLGCFAPGTGCPEIADPVDRDRSVFADTYALIEASARGLAGFLADSAA